MLLFDAQRRGHLDLEGNATAELLSSLLAMVVLMGLFAETAANLRLIGWEMNSGSTLHSFGSRTGTKKHFARFSCWAHNKYTDCEVKLYFSNDASKPYYQIVGGVTELYDKHSSTYCKDIKWGSTNEGTKQKLMQGYRWNSCKRDWGYAYTYLYVKKTTDPPFLQGTANQRFRAGGGGKLRETVTAGTTTGAQKITVGEFRAWTYQWRHTSIEQQYLYLSPTIIKDYKPLYDQKVEREISDSAMKSRVIVNDGCGKEFVKGMTGQITSQETLETSNKARWEKKFDFGLTQSVTASGGIGPVSISATTTLDFKWSTTNEMTETKTEKSVSTYAWPYHCTPGYECKFSIFKKVREIEIPVKFTFIRGDSTFTEMNKLVTTAETWHEEKHVNKLARRNCSRK